MNNDAGYTVDEVAVVYFNAPIQHLSENMEENDGKYSYSTLE
jgi:hypothetical protein